MNATVRAGVSVCVGHNEIMKTQKRLVTFKRDRIHTPGRCCGIIPELGTRRYELFAPGRI